MFKALGRVIASAILLVLTVLMASFEMCIRDSQKCGEVGAVLGGHGLAVGQLMAHGKWQRGGEGVRVYTALAGKAEIDACKPRLAHGIPGDHPFGRLSLIHI